MARTKTVTIEGEEFIIAPLNLDQVEEHIGAQPGESASSGGWRNHTLQAIANSLNNASSATNGDAVTVEKLRKRLDLVTLNPLYLAVLELSGLKPITKDSKDSPQGESPAARTEGPSTSSISETA